MSEWLDTPLIVIATAAVLTILYRFAHWQGTVDSDLANIKGFMAEIRADIKRILDRLAPAPATSNSPLVLTDFGKDLAADLDAQKWATETAPALLDQVKGK